MRNWPTVLPEFSRLSSFDISPLLRQLRWQDAFPRAVLMRGLQYAEQGRVVAADFIDDEGLHLRGVVQGSEEEPYECDIRLRPEGTAYRIQSRCTCPMASDCKHVLAVLYVVSREAGGAAPELAAASDSGLDEWQRWLRLWQRREPLPAGSELTADQSHMLVLRGVGQGQSPQLVAAMMVMQQGKRGGLVKPQNLRTTLSDPLPAPHGGWPEQDLLELGLLMDRQSERVGALFYSAIRGRASERALLGLLQRHPACFERATQPLRYAAAQPLVLDWALQQDGAQRLVARVGGMPDALLLRGESLWYVDVAQGVIGLVEADSRNLAMLARAPTLPPERSAALRKHIEANAATGLPLPRVQAPPRRLQAAPRAALSMRCELRPPPQRGKLKPRAEPYRMGIASFGFDYAGLRIDPAGPERQRSLLDGELVEVQRDRKAESALAADLRRRQLLPVSAIAWSISFRFLDLSPRDLLLLPKGEIWPLRAEDWASTLRALAAAGVLLDYTDDFPRPLREIAVDDLQAELTESGSAWFDLALGIDVEGQRIDLLPVLRQVLADPSFPLQRSKGERKDATWRVALDDERALRLPIVRLRALLAPLIDYLGEAREGPLRLHRTQSAALDAMGAADLRWRGDEPLRQRMLDLSAMPKRAKAPRGCQATLRPYQEEGLAWLNFLAAAGLGGVLADDMGLGKTVQVLAHLLDEKRRLGKDFRCLVVAPTSLMGNWRDEAERFAPGLKVLVLQGINRAEHFDAIPKHDLILTTYPLLSRDRERLLEHSFSLLVMDEAQAVKNARSQAAMVVREIKTERRLAMTGTPLENHLGELWAQFDAIEPGLLGSEREFTRLYRTPIEKHGDIERQARLNRRIGPLLLRRRKDQVLDELPPKTEIVRHLELEGGQRALYESLRLAQHQRVREAIAERGLAQSGIVVLDALLKLRQVCCDPRLVKLKHEVKVDESAKLDALLELLEGLLDEGRRVLLFSQFTGMLDLIEAELQTRGTRFLRLTGETPGAARADLVRRFQDGEAPLFLISLKAGGVGLNLTAADTVIHYDPWWNPAVEAQATDRAHRIGQDKSVFVYKLICRGTVEEKIQALQGRKADLAQAVLEGGSTQSLRFDDSDLAELFAPLI